ncbi:MAG: hypothetical protein RL026_1252 [Pseudomonadota bacterium]|jgi:thiamine-monophosphate kinase
MARRAGEFELIDRCFRALEQPGGRARADVALGIGDDGALLQVPAGQQLVAVLDTLVEGRHFPAGSPAESIGHRALAVNLSDLAAMGAEPAWALLALTLPADLDESWVGRLAAGLGALAAQHGVALVGGDTTGGPLVLSVQALGFVPAGAALRRSGGRPGDFVCVSGWPGEAAAGLALCLDPQAPHTDVAARLRRRFEYPTPRLALGQRLRGLATACIDVSDGLAADAAKLARASGCGLRLDAAALPVSADLRAVDPEQALARVLGGGDDYELCFSLPPQHLARLPELAAAVDCPLSVIGELTADPALRLLREGRELAAPWHGYDHFAVASGAGPG